MTFDRADSPDPAVVPRRFVARSLIALSALALAACSPSSDPAASASPDRIAIHFYQRGYVAGGSAASTTLTDAAIAAFARRHPEIQVVTIGLPWTQEGDLKMRAALINRRRIDVFRVTNDQLPDYIPASGGRLLAPIDDYLTEADRADISPGAMEAVTFDGRAMAWPLWSTALSLIANAELLAERGIEPPADRPWTWEEFRAALERAARAARRSGG
jgi:multiple sugar transport system substrate-binding protein